MQTRIYGVSQIRPEYIERVVVDLANSAILTTMSLAEFPVAKKASLNWSFRLDTGLWSPHLSELLTNVARKTGVVAISHHGKYCYACC
jgi:hypothetical protein